MPKRGEHIHKRKDGRWEARYKCGISIAGKTLYKSVYAKTYAEVKEKQQKCMAEYRKGAIPERCVTFGSALALWQEVNKSRNKGATNMRYANLIDRHIAPELSNIRISQINTARLSDFMNRKLESGRLDGKGGLSPAYVRSIMLVINSVIEFSIAECLCPPVKINIHMPAMQRKELEILNSSDQARLETALLADLDETSLGIYLTLQTGLRIGEVCALRWCDIDLARAIIHEDHYYTVGYSEKHQKIGTFRVDRMKEVNILTADAVEKPTDFNLLEFTRQVFDMYDGSTETVTLLCKNDMMNYIVDRFGDAVETSPTDHEHFTAVAEVSVSQTFFAWAFQFNGDIQIKGPESVVDRYKAMLTSALDK